MDNPDLLIIGAGSAGMAAAITAAELGLAVEVIEERPSIGGNLHRGADSKATEILAPYAKDHERGRTLMTRFLGCGATLRTGTLPWRLDADGSVALSGAVNAVRRPKATIIATGAMERPVPFAGWTLPGVMSVGAAQLMIKGSALVPQGDVVLAGTGPLLYLLAWQLLKLGAPPKAILDSARGADRFVALKAVSRFPALTPLVQGLSMIGALRRAGVRFHAIDTIEATGSDRLDTVVAKTGGKRIVIAADLLLVHDGVIAATQLSRLAGCKHIWDAGQHAHLPVTDSWGATSHENIFIAGDCGSIDGGKAAEAKGALAALRVAEKLGFIGPQERAARARPLIRVLARERRLRRFLDLLYPPRLALAGLAQDDTIVCRCENVTAGDIRAAIAAGADGPGKLKAFTRAGMGPCQGRMCGPTISNVAAATASPWDHEALLNIRPPLKPVPLSAIAGLEP